MENANIAVVPTTVRLESSKLGKPLAEIEKGAIVGSSSSFNCCYNGSTVTLYVKEYVGENELLTKLIDLSNLHGSNPYLRGTISFCKDRRIIVDFEEPRIPKIYVNSSSYEVCAVC